MANPTDEDISALAQAVVAELDPGTRIEDKIILSKRQLLAIAGGGLTAGALAQFGVSEAEAQSAAGAVGTSTDPVDVEAVQVNATQVGTSSNTVDVEAGQVNATGVATATSVTDTIQFPTTDPFEIEIDDTNNEVRFNRNP